MPGRDKNRAATAADADDDVAGAPGGQRCSCLPFCLLGGRGAASGGSGAAQGRRRRRRFVLRLSWFSSWPWLRKSGKKEADGDSKKKKGTKRRGRRLLLLLTTSLQAKKALASVVSGDGTLPPAMQVSSFGDAKNQNNRKPRPTADDTAPSGTRQPQASTAATSTRGSTAPALARQETSQPCPRPTDEPAAAGRIWRAPSRRHSLHQPDHTERPAGAGGLWTAATTLGVIVLFGRVTAVVFLCSCLYGTRFVRSRVAGAGASAKAKSSGGSSSSRRFGDPVGVADEKAVELSTAEECKKKVVMAGLLERAGKRPSSRFGR